MGINTEGHSKMEDLVVLGLCNTRIVFWARMESLRKLLMKVIGKEVDVMVRAQ